MAHGRLWEPVLHEIPDTPMMPSRPSSRPSGEDARCETLRVQRLVVVMVGLPARGKTYIARKLEYYLNWVGMACKVFNLGEYRRRRLGSVPQSDFFHPDNVDAREQRRSFATDALDDMGLFFSEGGLVGILDATNTTKARRALIAEHCREKSFRVLFVESVCEDDNQIRKNIMQVKIGLPDYSEKDATEAFEDFKERIDYYRKLYVPMSPEDDPERSFIKLVDVGRYFIVHRIRSYSGMRIVRYLMNLHIQPRSIYISRHGESEFNLKGLIGGDSKLSPKGRQYAARLNEFVQSESCKNLSVWCSTLQRTIETASYIKGHKAIRWKALDELDAGLCDGMTYEETAEKYPEMYQSRLRDKYHTRYPRGESYADVVRRLEWRLLELEREQNDVLVVCHQAVGRCLLAYFNGVANLEENVPYVKVPLHTVIKITPIPYGNHVQIIPLGPDAVSTHIPKIAEEPAPGAT